MKISYLPLKIIYEKSYVSYVLMVVSRWVVSRGIPAYGKKHRVLRPKLEISFRNRDQNISFNKGMG